MFLMSNSTISTYTTRTEGCLQDTFALARTRPKG